MISKENSNRIKIPKISWLIIIIIIISGVLFYNVFFTKKNYKLKRRNAMTEDDIIKIKNKFINKHRKNLKDN